MRWVESLSYSWLTCIQHKRQNLARVSGSTSHFWYSDANQDGWLVHSPRARYSHEVSDPCAPSWSSERKPIHQPDNGGRSSPTTYCHQFWDKETFLWRRHGWLKFGCLDRSKFRQNQTDIRRTKSKGHQNTDRTGDTNAWAWRTSINLWGAGRRECE